MNKWMMAAAAAAALLAAPARADDAAANAVYERMQAVAGAADPAAVLETIYAPDATYLPRYKQAGIDRREHFLKLMAGGQTQLRKNGGSIDMKFRIVERKRFGDLYVDNGYMRIAMKPKAGAAEEVHYGKFVTVLGRQADGRWAFVTDADSEAPAAKFEEAVAVPGLKFDR